MSIFVYESAEIYYEISLTFYIQTFRFDYVCFVLRFSFLFYDSSAINPPLRRKVFKLRTDPVRLHSVCVCARAIRNVYGKRIFLRVIYITYAQTTFVINNDADTVGAVVSEGILFYRQNRSKTESVVKDNKSVGTQVWQ